MNSSLLLLEKFNSMFSLDDETTKLVSLVFSSARQTIQKTVPTDFRCESNFEEKLTATETCLKTVIARFQKAESARREFLIHFQKWETSRELSIQKLNSIADTIHKDRLNSNVSKLVGASVGIIGGVAAVASIFFPPLLLPLAVGGGVTSGLGSATVLGTSVTELVLLKNRMEETKTILNADREDFAYMQNWFESSAELMNAIEEVIGCDVMLMLLDGIRIILDEFKALKGMADKVYEDKLKPLVEQLVEVCVPSNIILKFGVDFAPGIIVIFLLIFSLNFRNRQVYDSAIQTQRLAICVLSGVDVATGIGRVASAVSISGGKVVATTTPRLLSRFAVGAFAGVGIALDVVNVVLTSIDVHKGSFSKQEDDVRKVIEQLKEEYDYLKTVCNVLQN